MKKVLLIVLAIVLIGAAWYGYNEYSRTNEDLKDAKADFNMETPALIAAFEQDTASANSKYVDKVIAVSGNVKSIDANGNPVVLSLGDPGEMSSVLCSMDSTHAADYKNVREGQKVTVKGMCTGGETQDLFGTDVKLNRCVVVTN